MSPSLASEDMRKQGADFYYLAQFRNKLNVRGREIERKFSHLQLRQNTVELIYTFKLGVQ